LSLVPLERSIEGVNVEKESVRQPSPQDFALEGGRGASPTFDGKDDVVGMKFLRDSLVVFIEYFTIF